MRGLMTLFSLGWGGLGCSGEHLGDSDEKYSKAENLLRSGYCKIRVS